MLVDIGCFLRAAEIFDAVVVSVGQHTELLRGFFAQQASNCRLVKPFDPDAMPPEEKKKMADQVRFLGMVLMTYAGAGGGFTVRVGNDAITIRTINKELSERAQAVAKEFSELFKVFGIEPAPGAPA